MGTMTRIHCLVGWVLWVLAGIASAQSSFTVTPLRLELSPQASATIVEVINTSPGPLTIQVQQRAWVQNERGDAHGDTRDLILSPAIFTLPKGERQVVRIALRGTLDTRLERAYRILVSEVPAPQIRATPEGTGFRIALQMDLPMFVAPLQPSAPEPSYTLDLTHPRLIVRNGGTGHIRFTDFTVSQAGRKIVELPVFSVLPGSARAFELPRERLGASGGLRVQAESNAGPIDAAVADLR